MAHKYLLSALFFFCVFSAGQAFGQNKANFGIAIHGGAGTLSKARMTPEMDKAYREALTQALDAGYQILESGGTSGDAVVAAIKILEDTPLFNAGKGAVFTHEGHVELDAAFMDGKTLGAGSVAGVTTVKNPIEAARAVMASSPHVLLSGKGAEQFAEEQGLEKVENSYFQTDKRKQQLEKAKETDGASGSLNTPSRNRAANEEAQGYKFGTVGAVALDQHGNLTAGTSTGGMTNKRWGRVGDAPIIGAGTYANNKTCAVSCTGWGEYFMRLLVAYDVSAMMEYKNISLKEAANTVVMEKLEALEKETGGLIAIDKDGNVAMPLNTSGMYRGYRKGNGEKKVMIFSDEE